MHTPSDHKTDTHHIFELKILFLGLLVLLGMMLVIRFGSPGRRMNAEGIYSPAPMYGVQRYPRPISEFLRSSNASAGARSSTQSIKAEFRSSSTSSRQTEDRAQRRSERSRTSIRSSKATSNARFAPGWFWR